MAMFSTVFERLTNLLDAFDGLLNMARRFRGFLAFAAFLVLAFYLMLNSMFTEGSFDPILAKFSDMAPDHFYNLMLIVLLGTLLLFTILIILSFVDLLRRPAGTAVVEPEKIPLPGEDNDPDVTPILTGPGIPSPPQEPLPPPEQQPVSHPTKPLPQERIFVSYAERDYLCALKLAKFLRSKNYYVWNLEDAVPYVTVDVATEQAIRRSDMVVALLSNSFADSLRVRVETEFAAENRKPVIAVLTEEPNKILARRFPPHRRLTLFGNWEKETSALYARLREVSARGLRQPDEEALPQDQSAIDEKVLNKLGIPAPDVQAQPSVQQQPAPQPPEEPKRKPPQKEALKNAIPFVYGVAVRPEWFVGRQAVLNGITGRLGLELQSVSVVADRRMGKTSLLRYITSQAHTLLPSQSEQVAVYINMQDARAKTPAGIMRLLRQRIARELGHELWEERYDGDLTSMAESFEEISDNGTQLVLCLDEFENVMAYPELNDIIEQFRASGAMSQIGMVVATAHELSTLTETGGITSPFFNIFEMVYMNLMPYEEWVDLVRQAYARGGREVQDSELAIIQKLAGGHPSLTQMAGTVVWQARTEGWTPKEMREQFMRPASKILMSTWARLSETERTAVREAMGIYTDERAPQAVWDSLKRRGVLTPDNEVFCEPFADLVMAEEL